MKKLLIHIFAVCACVLVFSGCAGMSPGGKNPWAPPERKKPLAERWDEAEKKADAEKNAAKRAPGNETRPVPVVAVAESHEVAEVVFSDKKMAVAYRLGGIRVPVKKGEIFAARGKDLSLSGVVRLDVIDGDTLGFSIVAGAPFVGDFITIPGAALLEEMRLRFPDSVPAGTPEK